MYDNSLNIYKHHQLTYCCCCCSYSQFSNVYTMYSHASQFYLGQPQKAMAYCCFNLSQKDDIIYLPILDSPLYYIAMYSFKGVLVWYNWYDVMSSNSLIELGTLVLVSASLSHLLSHSRWSLHAKLKHHVILIESNLFNGLLLLPLVLRIRGFNW